MIRTVLSEIGLFLIPFVIYAVFLLISRADIWGASAWTMGRLAALTIVSLMLVGGSFVILAQFGGAPPGSTYVPAHIEGGKFVPGTTR
jgi:hypothetical protein